MVHAILPPAGAAPDVPALRAPSVAGVDEATLTLLDGPNAGQVFVIGRTESVIGRGAEASVWLFDPDVSRRHARVVADEGGYVIEDLGSTNGVFVGGRRVRRHALRSGDHVSFGKLGMRFDVACAFESSCLDAPTRA